MDKITYLITYPKRKLRRKFSQENLRENFFSNFFSLIMKFEISVIRDHASYALCKLRKSNVTYVCCVHFAMIFISC